MNINLENYLAMYGFYIRYLYVKKVKLDKETNNENKTLPLDDHV